MLPLIRLSFPDVAGSKVHDDFPLQGGSGRRRIIAADEDKAVVAFVMDTLRQEGFALRSIPEMESELPADVPALREPFTAGELRAVVSSLLDREADDKLAASL